MDACARERACVSARVWRIIGSDLHNAFLLIAMHTETTNPTGE